MKKILGIVVVLCAVAVSAVAIPARRGGVVRTAEDGTEQVVFLNGDESFHYITDAEGNWLDEETLQPMTEEVKKAKLQMQGQSGRAKAKRIRQETGTDRLLAPRGAVILVSYTDLAFESSNADIMLDSTLESEEALKGYAVHPAHVAVANGVVRPNTELRTCLDYQI